jgi:hypothetical protein
MRKSLIINMAAMFIALSSYSVIAQMTAVPVDIPGRVQAIKEDVQAKGGTFEVGYSAAMDKSIRQLCGLKIPEGWNKSDAPRVAMLKSSIQALPSSYDWRKLNGVTPIKNQGSCGGCWAFGTVGPLESQILIKDGVTVDLSEQYLLSCNVDGWSCDGGWWAHDYHMDVSGLDNSTPGAVLEASIPYVGTDEACGGPYNHPYKISGWAYIASDSDVPSVQDIKQAIYTYGPVSGAVYVGSAFQAYTGGIFNTDEDGTVNHGIVLVGWNDDRGTDDGYWILKNSWGQSWGEAGYMRIRYGINQVGFGACFIEYPGGSPPPPPVEKPDLTGAFTKLVTKDSGKTLSGTFKVENTGNAATTSSFKVLFYLSVDGIAKTSLLATNTVSKLLEQNSSSNIQLSKTSKSSFKGKYVVCVIDSDNAIPDSNRDNNVIVKLIP